MGNGEWGGKEEGVEAKGTLGMQTDPRNTTVRRYRATENYGLRLGRICILSKCCLKSNVLIKLQKKGAVHRHTFIIARKVFSSVPGPDIVPQLPAAL